MSGPRPRPGVLQTAPYVQGASSIEGIEQPIKLSSNESPLGPSPNAIAAYQAAATRLFRYPDGGQQELRTAIAEVFGLEAGRLVFGNGSDEVIQLLIRAYAGPGDDVVLSQYSFSMCRTHALAQGANVITASEPDCRISVDRLLAAVTPATRLVALASPNNPCGTFLPRAELARLHAGLPADVLLLIDAAYADYVVDPDYDCGFDLARTAGNVVVTRTFSKLYGLAALRIGWGYGPPAVIDSLQRIRTPFNTNAAALAAAAAAVRDREYARRVRDHNLRWLERLLKECTKLGLHITPSAANFVLIHFAAPPHDALQAKKFLVARGVIPRALGAGAPDNTLRVTIGLDHENEALLAALAEFLGKEAGA
jgi:histidinol-phosphate aminotransferase